MKIRYWTECSPGVSESLYNFIYRMFAKGEHQMMELQDVLEALDEKDPMYVEASALREDYPDLKIVRG